MQMMTFGAQGWLVSGYAEAREAFTHPALSRDGNKYFGAMDSGLDERVRAAMNHHMLNSDPPDHTRLRRMVVKVFTARRIAALAPRITEIAARLLDAVKPGEPVDIIDAFGFPLPIQVICELLGIPSTDQNAFREWSNVIVAGAFAGDKLPVAAKAMTDYIHELLARKRTNPADDLLSDLIAVRDEGDALSEDELTSMVFLLLIAGHETTVNLIGNSLYLLLTHPDQLDRLRADRELVPSTIEEVLRYEGPLRSALPRFATADLELGDVTIKQGDIVMISPLAANRDSGRFDDAETFDVGRGHSQHVAFGHGLHFCLGAPLARLEGKIALEAILDRFSGLELATELDQLVWRPSGLMRGLAALPISVTLAASR
jgi:cytochrome P450